LFGGYDADTYSKTKKITWHNIGKYANYWMLDMKSMGYSIKNTDGGVDKFNIKNKKIIIDSGTSFILMPTKDITGMVNQMAKSLNIQCVLKIVPICQCPDAGKDAFPDLHYNMDGESYFIPKGSYMLQSGNKCYLKIMHHPTLPFHIMGLNFFQNYYTVFDQEKKRVGFAPSIHADERLDAIIKSAGKLISIEQAETYNKWAVEAGVSIVVLMGLIAVCYKIRKDEAKKSLNRNEYQSVNNDSQVAPTMLHN